MNPELATMHDRIGPYQLVKAIGAGGSARIDLARIDRAYGFQRHVVIKRPLEHLRKDAKAAASLRREAAIGARLRHPNLVAILDAGVHDGYDYLVLEYVHGGSLRTLMQADSPSRVRDCSLDVAIAIVGDVARALHDAHELADTAGHPLGLVHRDVSPGNIMVGLDGAVKLADFGIAKETRVQTLSGSMHGTVTYMAPEQCRGHAFDRRADVFSLGVVLYELVTGTRLFWADNDVASLHRVLSGTVPRPRKVRPAIPPALEEIVMTALAHDQDKRFTTARDLADALENYAADAGHVLGARWIARWAHEILGAREVPWIGSATIPDLDRALARAASSDGSLVELIASITDEAPPDPTFGPTASFSDEIDTNPRRSPGGKRHKALASVIALGLLGGAAVTALVMSREDAPPAATPVTIEPSVEPKVEAPAPPPASEKIEDKTEDKTDDKTDDTTDDKIEDKIADAPAEDVIEIAPERVRRKKRRPQAPEKPTPPVVVVEQPKSNPPPPPPAGSAAVTRSSPKAAWNPTMLLPTDPGSGTKKK